ncbi:Protocadherin-1 [Clonorchis sinensis]|uniref:Protocadherin-1 n=1 Tax=Clonorchis sinensis TaxID=79923 RepID=A0A419PLF8_CLOSI|nr:Protocadherin-1 [Clonorchis sinensis]
MTRKFQNMLVTRTKVDATQQTQRAKPFEHRCGFRSIMTVASQDVSVMGKELKESITISPTICRITVLVNFSEIIVAPELSTSHIIYDLCDRSGNQLRIRCDFGKKHKRKNNLFLRTTGTTRLAFTSLDDRTASGVFSACQSNPLVFSGRKRDRVIQHLRLRKKYTRRRTNTKLLCTQLSLVSIGKIFEIPQNTVLKEQHIQLKERIINKKFNWVSEDFTHHFSITIQVDRLVPDERSQDISKYVVFTRDDAGSQFVLHCMLAIQKKRNWPARQLARTLTYHSIILPNSLKSAKNFQQLPLILVRTKQHRDGIIHASPPDHEFVLSPVYKRMRHSQSGVGISHKFAKVLHRHRSYTLQVRNVVEKWRSSSVFQTSTASRRPWTSGITNNQIHQMATTALEATLLQRLLWLDITFKSFSITLLLVLISLFDQTFGSIQESVTHHSADSITPFASGFPIARVYVAVQEELSPGAIITELSTHPLVKNLITQTDATQIHETFQYHLMNAFDSHLFRITGTSGRLTIATRLDREALCASQKAQFCCNNRAQIPSSLMSDESWKLIEAVPKSQLCHLVAHISLQPNKPASQSESGTGQTGIAQINRLALVYLYIRLDDINDHAPQFASPTTTLNVAEDATVGSVLHYFRVTDPDAGANGLRDIKLSVAPLSGTSLSANSRNIEPVRGISTGVLANPFDVRLSRDGASLLLQAALDRESIPAYDLTLTALDGDPISPKSSQLNLRVLVTDANDNAPTWVRPLVNANKLQPENADVHIIDQSMPQFNVSISEDTQVGALVFWLQARDADVGDNARLTYAIDTGAPGGLTALNYFSVQSTTGEVRLRAQLDYDSASANSNGAEIEVPITVQDNPHIGRPLMARAVLFVRILDVNDIHPIIVASPLSPVPLRRPFLMNTVPSQYTSFGVWENQPAGQPVASILVSDPDTGGGGKVSCSVQSDYFRLASESIKTEFFETIQSQSISNYPFSDGELISGPITYQLISTQILDREHIPRHQVLLTCRDHDQSKPLVSTRRLDIEVLDENDNAPEFMASLIELTCPENSPPGQIIGVVNATDKDVGENARLRFWVNEASSSWISIHQQTGEVRVNTVFDREQETERRFTVFVSDSAGSTAHTASAEVCIRILDENDHSPQFVDLYFFSVSENSPPGTEIGQIKADDADSGENGKVSLLSFQPIP